MSSPSEKQNTEPRIDGQMLNVVLHGLFGIVLWESSIELLVPQIEDHVFLAGDWRQERRLKQGATYRLEGVSLSGKAIEQVSKKSLKVRRFPLVDRNPAKLFCSIFLPFPMDVRRSRHMSLGGDFHVAGQSVKVLQKPKDIAVIQILRYRIADMPALTLGPELRWFPKATEDNTVNLHIFSEGLTGETIDEGRQRNLHFEEAFSNLVRLFPGMDLKVSGAAIPTTRDIVENIGLPAEEQVTLSERNPDIGESQGPESFGNPSCPPLVVDNR